MVNTIYSQKSKFILLGLTGRIGSGCTTAVEFLSKTTKQHNIKEQTLFKNIKDSHRKKYIIDKFYRKNWESFRIIKASDFISLFMFQNDFDKLNKIISNYNEHIKESKKDKNDSFHNRLKSFDKIPNIDESFRSNYQEIHQKFSGKLKKLKNHKKLKPNKIETLYNLINTDLKKSANMFREEFSRYGYKHYTDLFQLMGDNIRLYGNIKINEKNKSNNKVFKLVEYINYGIKIIRKYNEINKKPTYIAIDAIRNPMESYYLKERYSSYYLISISAPDDDIKDRLEKKLYMTEDAIDRQSKKETKVKLLDNIENFISQNIQSCIEKSDIFITNVGKYEDKNFKELYGQLIKFVSLIKHPGLITPSLDEKMMQIAYTAKLNSACLSRQVGASVTNKNGSLKSIGWNSVPEGQTPCLLRSRDELLDNTKSLSYSKYEKSLEFKNMLFGETKISDNLGINQSFCFKSIYTKNKKDNKGDLSEKGNQVHTRSLHAEENAFLQLSKYGGEALKDGVLYSTASPCELCSKKAYQLGIKRVVFIDPYPGIARQQILNSGRNKMKVELFKGAIGSAYHKFYEQIIPFKDEIDSLLKFQQGMK